MLGDATDFPWRQLSAPHLEQMTLRAGERADPHPVTPDVETVDRLDYRASFRKQARLLGSRS